MSQKDTLQYRVLKLQIKKYVLQSSYFLQVLDMCAAPGSKTAQLIEMIHADEKIPIPGNIEKQVVKFSTNFIFF